MAYRKRRQARKNQRWFHDAPADRKERLIFHAHCEALQEDQVRAGKRWRSGRGRMPVAEARTMGEAAHLLCASGEVWTMFTERDRTLLEPLAVLWQQERALRRELTARSAHYNQLQRELVNTVNNIVTHTPDPMSLLECELLDIARDQLAQGTQGNGARLTGPECTILLQVLPPQEHDMPDQSTPKPMQLTGTLITELQLEHEQDIGDHNFDALTPEQRVQLGDYVKRLRAITDLLHDAGAQNRRGLLHEGSMALDQLGEDVHQLWRKAQFGR